MASVRELVDDVAALVTDCGRADLAARLRATRARLDDPAVRVVVVGEFGAGKSQLVNALVNAPVCPVDDDAATAVATVVAHADPPAAHLVHADAAGEHRTPVAIDSLADHVLARGGAGLGAGASGGAGSALVRAEVGLPRQVLAGGLVLVDTPGVGGPGPAHTLAAMEALAGADAVLVTTDAAQELTAPELDLVRRAAALCPNLACVVTKIDLHPHWRRIVELDRAHLAAAGLEVPLLPVSSVLRLHAVRSQDGELNAESGVPALLHHLRQDVVDSRTRLSHRSTAHDLLAVLDHLEVSLRSEADALADPARAATALAGLSRARGEADALRAQSARWQQTLADGTADLVADLDHDLRDRFRAIQRDADDALDHADPAKVWDQFAVWLQARTGAAVAEDFVWGDERASALAAAVAAHFARAGEHLLPDLPSADPAGALAAVTGLGDLEAPSGGPVARLVTGLRGSYSGIVMVGLLTGVAGMAIVNPISLGAGLLLGGKTYRDDASARLQRRRAEAKNAVRRHLDEVVFQVSKASRDRLRQSQRGTRDHFTAVAEELHRSLSESVAAATRAASADDAERARRGREVAGLLGRAQGLRPRAQALARAGSAAAGAAPGSVPAPASAPA